MNFKEIEKKIQAHWNKTPDPSVSRETNGKKSYVLEMFPYPSGKLHMGHVRNYTIGDVIARWKYIQGYEVLHPMGWDAFGLPAENAAIERGLNPADWTYKNIETMKVQLQELGFSFDWSREIKTCDPDYYQHEQRFFIELYNKGLVYQKESEVNWDPVDNCVLANEQVVDGKGWRSGAPVEKKLLKQWYLKTTAYSDELLEDLKSLEDWPEKVKVMQENWIGRSEGYEIPFQVIGRDETISIFTTRIETLYGASFIGLSPKHPFLEQIELSNTLRKEIKALEPQDREITEKKGVQLPYNVAHPLTGAEIPLYVANFVLEGYGTGAIFACPAHDERDHEFAKKYGLPITQVIRSTDDAPSIEEESYLGEGTLMNSGDFDGLSISEGKEKIGHLLENKIGAVKKTNYRLKDWGVSRQRYWGCPVPMIHCPSCGIVPEKLENLPVTLPKDVKITGSGNPLDKATTWKETTCPTCGGAATRETDTFDTFFESSWYFLKFVSRETNPPFTKEEVEKFLPVDFYIGGIEHAVMHLLYARFFTKALRDLGYFSLSEPFKKLITQGMVCHKTYKTESGKWCYPDEIKKTDAGFIAKESGEAVIEGPSEKMSKSKKNTVDPGEMAETYGVDAIRFFVVSDSPIDKDLEWDEAGTQGVWRFLKKIENTLSQPLEFSEKNDSALGNLFFKAQEHLEKIELNKYIAVLYQIASILLKKATSKDLSKEDCIAYLQLLYPVAPHLASYLYERHFQGDIREAKQIQAQKTESDTLKLPVQFRGKTRGFVEIRKDLEKDEILDLIRSDEKLLSHMPAELTKVIYVPGKIINIV